MMDFVEGKDENSVADGVEKNLIRSVPEIKTK
jgi:hypothetical protein